MLLMIPATAHPAPLDLDPNWDNDGIVVEPLLSGATFVGVQASGHVVVAGSTANTFDLDLARLNSDGSVDETFAAGGEAAEGCVGTEAVEVEPDDELLVLTENCLIKTSPSGEPSPLVRRRRRDPSASFVWNAGS